MLTEAPKDIRMREITEIIDGIITPQSVYSILERLQDPAPSGTVLHTRTPQLQELALAAGISQQDFNAQFLGTRSPAVLMNMNPQRVYLFSAHSDTISYLFPRPTNESSSDLNPNFAHRPNVEREFPAAVLRWDERLVGYETVSTGIIGWKGVKADSKPFYIASVKPKNGFFPSDRVVFTPTISLDTQTGLVSGNMDNAAGLAICMAALRALSELAKARGVSVTEYNVGFVFPDEEEGLPEDPAYFSRGARQIGNRAVAKNIFPKMVVNVDGHDMSSPGNLVRYAASVSKNKGPVVPPDIYFRFKKFLEELVPYGVISQMTEAGGALLSRSDDAAWMEFTSNLMPVGYDVLDPHFNDGPPTTNLNGLVQTAKAVAMITAEMPKQY